MQRLKKEDHNYLNEAVISSLNENGIYSARDFISSDSQKLAKISLLLFKDILDIKKALLKKHSAVSQNGYDCYHELLKNSALISSGVQSIDDFFDGGLLTSNIYEIYGRAGSGKTLLAYSFIKNLVLKTKQYCIILDSKNDFSAKKFFLLCGEFSYEDILMGLSKILVKAIENKYHLLNSFQEILENFDENKTPPRFIMLDSLTAAITNHNDHAENNMFLNHLANVMHIIAAKYHVVIFVTNLMTTWIEGDFSVPYEVKQRVSCGKFWYTIPNSRVKIERRDQNFELSIEKSNTLKPKSILVPFTDIINKQ